MATVADFYGALGENAARVLHLAMHSAIHASSGTSTLAFTKEGDLDFSDEHDVREPEELAERIGRYARGRSDSLLTRPACVECVVLNMCRGDEFAKQLINHGVPTVIAWETDADNHAASVFATGFYASLKAQPADFDAAFKKALDLLKQRRFALVDPEDEDLVDPDGIVKGTYYTAAGIPCIFTKQ
jgi:hypothetical protein